MTESEQIVYISCIEEVRYSFVSHLCEALRRKGIHDVFVDSDDLLSKESQSTVERARVSVMVLPGNHKVNLDKLAKVLECQKNKYQMVVPVLYGVIPLDFEWRRALESKGFFSSFHYSRNECTDSELVEDINRDVYEKLFYMERIGIYSKLQEIENMVWKQPFGVRCVGLWGMLGIGKTTLAKAVFDQMSGDFDAYCFIEDYEKVIHEKGLYRLLEEHFLKDKPGAGSTIAKLSLLSNKLKNTRVLVVLDDVRSPLMAEPLLGGFGWFGPKSLIIITSRDKQVFRLCRVNQIFKVQGLNEKEALQLFSLSASIKNNGEQNFHELSTKVIEYANGNPLALSIYGREFKGKNNLSEMETTFLKLKGRPHIQIVDAFKSSYDSLNDREKNIFLDIACFFHGENVDYVMQLLGGCGFLPHVGIDVLVEKCLVAISENRVWMHNLIQDVGQEIINTETEQIERRSRLWEPGSIKDLLEDNEHAQGTEEIEGMFLDTLNLSFDIKPVAFDNMLNLRFLKIYCSSPKIHPVINFSNGSLRYLPNELRLLHWENYPLQFLPENFDPMHLVEINMPYSQLQTLWGKPKNLKMLRTIRLCHSQKLVEVGDLSKAQDLEVVDLQGCTRLQSPPATDKLLHLRVVNLSGCREIKEFPEVRPNIEALHLQGTGIRKLIFFKQNGGELASLSELEGLSKALKHELLARLEKSRSSSQELAKLICLDLKDCTCLQSLPNMVNLELLKVLDLSGCSELKTIKGFPPNLKELSIAGTAVREVPQLPQSLELFNAHGCVSLKSIHLDSEKLPMHYTFSNCFDLSPQVINDFLVKALANAEHIPRERQKELNKSPAFSFCAPSHENQNSTLDLQPGSSVMTRLIPSWRKTLVGFAMLVEVAFSEDYDDATGFGISCVCRWSNKEGRSRRIKRNLHCWALGKAVQKDHMFVFCDVNMHPISDEGNDPDIWADLVVFEFFPVDKQTKPRSDSCTVRRSGVRVITDANCNTSIENISRVLSLDSMEVSGNEVLRISYDGLEEIDKALFLYIVGLFNDEDVGLVAPHIANIIDMDVSNGLKVLADRSLIRVSSNGEIVMPCFIRQMGKEILYTDSKKIERLGDNSMIITKKIENTRKRKVKKVDCIVDVGSESCEGVESEPLLWRKYGQKPIKGSPYPRSYYRCNSPKDCLARKQVEHSHTDPNMLVITYISEHSPPCPTQSKALAGSTRSSSSSKCSVHFSKALVMISSSLSLPSSPPSLSPTWKHDVFPSFHGPDVRRNFLSHILESFKRKGIETFNDNDIERRSNSIGPELVEAIKGSKIAMVLLSRKYSSFSWCLDELVEIMKCREELGQIVMTIFYEVDPIDIKKQTGEFGKAFRKTCKGKTKEDIEKWKKALEDVANIAGEHSRNWNNEAAMIEKIATDLSNILNKSTPSRDFDGLVGMKIHMEEMEELLRLDLDEVRMIGIWGPPGIGKTTIARVLFNQVSSIFQLGAIMVNIREYCKSLCLDEYNAQLQLQNQMLSQIFNQKDIKIFHLGVAQERLKNKKVLLVLDDVDRLGQLDALAKGIQWFGPGSRIIITTEDLSILDAHGINHVYKVNFPSSDEAFQIFCMNAFGQKHPYDGFYDLAREVTKLAGDLPFGLKVLGSALKGMSKQEWEKTLPSLKTLLDKDVGSIMKFRYDALDDEDKYLFLYIACLFNHESIDKVEEVLAKHFSSVGQSLHILAQKSLISIGCRRIHMHILLQKFGRETSKKEFVHHDHAKHQLLVGARDICEVLSDDTTDSRHFIGINLDLSEIEEELNISEKAIERLRDFQFVKINGKDLAHPKRLHSLLYHSQKIRSLHWRYFQNKCLPSNFNPEFLVELNMQGSKLEKLWEGTKKLRNLKWIDLSHSTYLKELPDLSTATNLEELILEDCSSLVEIPSSIGNAINLQILNLRSCSSLLELSSSIGNAIKLQELDLSYCSSLLELPSSIGNAINLPKVFLKECSSLVELPSFIMNITHLEELDLERCSSLVKLPFSLGNATNLQKLNLSHCTSLVEIPSSIENATNLQKLDLSNCSNLVELPSIGNATELEELNLNNCVSLVQLPSFINAPNLQELYLKNCSQVVELPAMENVTNLQVLDLQNCSSLLELHPSIGNATNLQELDISGCSSLMKLPSSIGNATNLQELDISGCSSLMKLPSSIGNLINLNVFNLNNCSSLVELPSSIGNLQQLYWLGMCGCSKLEALPTNINLGSLLTLDLTDCSQLKSFPEISTNIEDLNLTGTAIKEVPLSIMSWSRLYEFQMSYFESLKDFPHALDIITELHLVDEDIKEVPPWVKRMSRLDKFRLYNCNSLVSLPQLSDSLSDLVAENCHSLERLYCSFNNPNIRLEFVNCFKLNQDARDLIMHTSTSECAILPGTEVPACFNHRATGGVSLTIKLNESPLPTSLRFKACIMPVKVKHDKERPMFVDIDIMDKQKGLKVQCTPSHRLIYPLLTEHIYTYEVEAKEVTSTELVFEFKTDHRNWKIGECGLLQILEVPSF